MNKNIIGVFYLFFFMLSTACISQQNKNLKVWYSSPAGVGLNSNSFYQVEETPSPIISSAVKIIQSYTDSTRVYDLPMKTGKIYTLVAQ